MDTRGREALANATRGVMAIYGKAFADWVCHPTGEGGGYREGAKRLVTLPRGSGWAEG